MKPKIPLPDGTEIEIIQLEYAGQPVYATKQLAELFGCSANTLSHIFRDHRAEFVEGVDFFVVEGEALRRLKREQNQGAGESPVAGRGKRPLAGANEVPIKGAGESPVAGRGKRPLAGANEVPIKGAGESHVAGQGKRPLAGTNEVPVKGAGESHVAGQGKRPLADNEPIFGKFVNRAYLWTKSGAYKISHLLSTDKAKFYYSGLAFANLGNGTAAEPEPAKASTRLDLLMEMIRLTKNDDLRDKLIREAAELVLGKKV